MTEPTAETGRPLDENPPETDLENPTQELPDLSEEGAGNEHSFDEEEVVADPELEKLESLERHGLLTNAQDQNRLAELREGDSNGEVDG